MLTCTHNKVYWPSKIVKQKLKKKYICQFREGESSNEQHRNNFYSFGSRNINCVHTLEMDEPIMKPDPCVNHTHIPFVYVCRICNARTFIIKHERGKCIRENGWEYGHVIINSILRVNLTGIKLPIWGCMTNEERHFGDNCQLQWKGDICPPNRRCNLTIIGELACVWWRHNEKST